MSTSKAINITYRNKSFNQAFLLDVRPSTVSSILSTCKSLQHGKIWEDQMYHVCRIEGIYRMIVDNTQIYNIK